MIVVPAVHVLITAIVEVENPVVESVRNGGHLVCAPFVGVAVGNISETIRFQQVTDILADESGRPAGAGVAVRDQMSAVKPVQIAVIGSAFVTQLLVDNIL